MDVAAKNELYGRDRRRVSRRAVHSPAYASLNGSSQSAPLELWEILNISESGTCIQAPSPMKVNRLLPLVLDLSETGARIHTTGHVVWAESSGKTGIRFPELPEVSQAQLREWMHLNEVAGQAHANEESSIESPRAMLSQVIRSRPNTASSYTSLIAEWAEIQRDVELFGPNLEAALQLIADRAMALTWATGAAIALANETDLSDLICVARAGNDSPELGTHLNSAFGLSAECVRSATTLKCDDTETDPRVEPESFRALGIRSIVASPVKTLKGEVMGVIEVFSTEPAAFWDNDGRTLERLARIAGRAITQAMHASGKALPVLEFKSEAEEMPAPPPVQESKDHAASTISAAAERSIVLFIAGIIVVIFAVWFTAPWISTVVNRFVSPPDSQAAESAPASSDFVGMEISDLKKSALQGNAGAQYAIAIRYASGDGVQQDYHEALAWFLKAADGGNTRAAAKIASCFWAGKGAPQDYSKAYFWGLLAEAAGDETGQVIVINSSPHLNDHQRHAEQQEADAWLRSHKLGFYSSRASH